MADRILVVGPAWVGDMVMAQSLYITLRAKNPDARIDVVAPAWSQPLLARMPEVEEGIELPLGHGELGWTVRRRLGHALRGRAYDRAIVLPRSFKSALVPFHARIPRRTGYRGESRYFVLNDIRPLDASVLTQTVQRYVALGLPAGSEQPPAIKAPDLTVDEDNQRRLTRALGLDRSRPVVAIMPGAEFGPAKCWPLAYFGELARALEKQGNAVWLLGSERDRPSAAAIAEAAGGATANLCGRTRLEDAIDLLALADRAITNDSGLMHVAAAVGCHVVAIYGSTTPAYTPPLTHRRTVHYLDLECSPCHARQCPLGHFRCMRDITPERVLQDLTPP